MVTRMLFQVSRTCLLSSTAIVGLLEHVEWADCEDAHVLGRTDLEVMNTWSRHVPSTVLVLTALMLHVF